MAEIKRSPYTVNVRGFWFAATVACAEVVWAGTEVYFAPGDNPTGAVVRELNGAKSNVLVQAYSFTSAPIAKAVVEAHRRGVEVTVVLDKSQRTERYSSADFLVNMGVPTLIDDKHAMGFPSPPHFWSPTVTFADAKRGAHNKVMVIDGKKVITGSFNFTKAAEEKNAENLVVLDDSDVARKYTTNWQAHAGPSIRYEGRRAPRKE